MMHRAHLCWCALVIALLCPSLARAQACCTGGATLMPARLERHEWMLIGSQLNGKHLIGTFAENSRYRKSPPETIQQDLELQLFVTTRLAERVQLGGLVPWLFSHRAAPGVTTEYGGGLGDVELSARWDALFAGELTHVPGVALIGSGRMPTGTAPDAARRPLGSDATSTGAAQLAGAVVLEEYYGPWLLNFMGNITHHFPSETQGVTLQRGTQFRALASVGHAWTHRLTTALLASVTWGADAQVDGSSVPGSATRITHMGLASAYSPNNDWRFFASLTLTPPLDGLGKNELAFGGASCGALYAFW